MKVIQFVSKEYAISSSGKNIYISYDSGISWAKWISLPASSIDTLFGCNHWLSRLFRKDISHILNLNNDLFACFGFGNIFLISKESGEVKSIGSIEGSRPLHVCTDGKFLYYGVYDRNKHRKSISVYRYSLRKNLWDEFYSFKNIRHIHGVFWDEYQSNLWVTTGDFDHESFIIRFDKKGIPFTVATGSQQTRTVDLLFTKDFVFYATDAPDDPNYIYRIDRNSGGIEKLQQLGGPVFWGIKVGNWLFFSTVVEPSEVNRTDAVELWGSNDQGDSWRKIKEFKKDIGHMKLFQYGQLKFPYGPGDHEHLWFTPYATEQNHQILRIPLNSL